MKCAARRLTAALCVIWTNLSAAQAFSQANNLKSYRDFALGRDGDASRGKMVFENESKAACVKCHSIDGSSSKAGPDLFAVGDKLPRRDIIDSILEPSAAIAVGYGSTIVRTKGGDDFTGVIKQSSDKEVEIALGDGRKVQIPTRDIAEQYGSAVSLMPEGFSTGLSREEFGDLVEYLVTLKDAVSTAGDARGNPATVLELARPVQLHPFLTEDLRFPHAVVHKPGDIRSGLVWFGQSPGFSNLFFVVHQTGKVWLLEKNASGDAKSLFADFNSELFNERGPNGLLGMAFHPQFRQNRKYYLKHQVFETGKIATVLVEKIASPDGRSDSGLPSRRLLTIFSTTQDHSGGCIAFGPDGYLYLAMGDTGPQQDPQGHGQDMLAMLGKIVRLDVDHAALNRPYAIPTDNPFRSRSDVLPEIWASGFREPWRFSFDSLTGDLWVGDVGQDRVEEVAIVRRGENHGWNVYEGFEPFSNRYRKEHITYTPPIFAYRRKYGNSITGGYVYRADKNSSFYGVYICGDYTSHRIWGLTHENRTLKQVRQIAMSPQNIASFAQDEAGNIYVVGYEGMIYILDFSSGRFDDKTFSAADK